MKYSVCNELFGSMPLDKACSIAKAEGFSGIEFAPFTVFGDFSDEAISRGLETMRHVLDGEGLAFVGFHWLMSKPDGLRLASPDMGVRKKSKDHLARLLEASGRLGGGVLVLGSPKQRMSQPGQNRTEATAILCETLADLASLASSCRSKILIEQLSPDQTDVINSMKEAAGCVEAIGIASVDGMFDFHNAMSEKAPWNELIDEFYPHIGHIHINEIDGRAPGTGSSDYRPSYKALKRKGYDKWVSIEIFEIPANPSATLRDSMSLFKTLEGG